MARRRQEKVTKRRPPENWRRLVFTELIESMCQNYAESDVRRIIRRIILDLD